MTDAVPYLDLRALQQELGGELGAATARVLGSGWYLLGPELEAFEREFAAYCGTRHCVGVASGVSAIELALRAAGVGPGDEVIVPAYTWIATWLAVSRTGARPVGVDVVESTYNINPELIEAAIGERTAAIVPVHLRGEPADMDAIGAIAANHGLLVIEDAAQAHGARHRERRVGGIGRAGAFSFYPTKNLGGIADGGAVTTDDDELAERVRRLRNFGMRDRYEIEEAGVNSRLSEIQAAALRVMLPRLDGWNRARADLAGIYYDALRGHDAIALPSPPDWADPVWHLLVIDHPDREACASALAERGIGTLVHYPVLPHRAGPYREEWPAGSFPVADRLAAGALSLPLYPQLDPAACERVAKAVQETLPSPSSA
ncbi:MAG TPA: DegT/DnrJ/EryC1/StrS family aminotransferase [Solirubrobacterales bacterium]